jgi:hypothetical protein
LNDFRRARVLEHEQAVEAARLSRTVAPTLGAEFAQEVQPMQLNLDMIEPVSSRSGSHQFCATT